MHLPLEKKRIPLASNEGKKQRNSGLVQFKDQRESTAQLKQLQDIADSGKSETIQRKANTTGLPDRLKAGIENLSGYAMDDVKVHYNSSQPAQLQAHAYAQGNQIHLGPGQERHLPHEAWHVVQQKQGRVQPTKQLKSSVPVNDDAGLEKEADVMGAKALQFQLDSEQKAIPTNQKVQHEVVQGVFLPAAVTGYRAGFSTEGEWGADRLKHFSDFIASCDDVGRLSEILRHLSDPENNREPHSAELIEQIQQRLGELQVNEVHEAAGRKIDAKFDQPYKVTKEGNTLIMKTPSIFAQYRHPLDGSSWELGWIQWVTSNRRVAEYEGGKLEVELPSNNIDIKPGTKGPWYTAGIMSRMSTKDAEMDGDESVSISMSDQPGWKIPIEHDELGKLKNVTFFNAFKLLAVRDLGVKNAPNYEALSGISWKVGVLIKNGKVETGGGTLGSTNLELLPLGDTGANEKSKLKTVKNE